MKKLLKLTLLAAGICLSTSLLAQEEIKKEAKKVSQKQEAPNASEKQEPVKINPKVDSSSSKKDVKKDSSGSTKMAITEQGIPKNNKNKNKKSSMTPPPSAEPQKK